MTRRISIPDSSEPDLIDRIADSLPAEIRADYYREMRHCRSLPENDEMLRILRIMQFLTLLTVQVPERLATERDRLDNRLNQLTAAIDRWFQASEANYRNLEERLTQLPSAIAQGISPQAIAGEINENLRQQFVRSTIPQIGSALSAVAKDLRRSTGEFADTAKSLVNQYTGAAEEARRAIRGIETSISNATAAAKHVTSELSATFRGARRWAMVTTLGIGLCAGVPLGSSLKWPFHRREIAAGPSATAQEETTPPMKKTPEGARAHDPRHVGR
jgi:hypothetical protein